MQQHMNNQTPVSVTKARQLIVEGQAPENMHVDGGLTFVDGYDYIGLPSGLTIDRLNLSGCTQLETLPDNLTVRHLNLAGCTTLQSLPKGLRCYELNLQHTRIQSLPDDLQVEYRLDLEGCHEIVELPENFKVGSLVLRECTALQRLPEGLDVYFLDISGCTGLREWPQQATIQIGRLIARGCSQLQTLPSWLTNLSQLDLRGCVNLTDLPATLAVNSWIDLADTQIEWLPVAARSAQLRWRGVPVNERIVFHPETITAEEVLNERNAERRRVMLERMGYEAFLEQANAEVLDRDSDPGGERRLLKVAMVGDEDLVCVSVICPSTGRQYLIRVPPQTRTCHQAAAWIAGFDDPNAYQPIAET
ncbi:MAG: DUF6745 domain-containing protein [Chloroflexota bacterium]